MKMKIHLLLLMYFIPVYLIVDVYVIIYATYQGKTGHAGIAIDNYDYLADPNEAGFYHTVKNGKLTYFDLWPKNDNRQKDLLQVDVEASYYQLPAASSEPPVTLSSLYYKGIPHKEGYPCDAILQIPLSADSTALIMQFILDLIGKNRPFNTQSFNFADFVATIIEKAIGHRLEAKEFILFHYSTTPNRIANELMKLKT